jgi:hypothetical protein
MTSRGRWRILPVVATMAGLLWWATGLARVVHFHQEACGQCSTCRTSPTTDECCSSDGHRPCESHRPESRHDEQHCSLCQQLSAVKAPALEPPADLPALGPAVERRPTALTDAPRVEPPLSLGSRDPPASPA